MHKQNNSDNPVSKDDFEEIAAPETSLLEESEHVVSNSELEALIEKPTPAESEEAPAISPETKGDVSAEMKESAIDSMTSGIEALVFASGVSITKSEIRSAFAGTWKDTPPEEQESFQKLLNKAFTRFVERWKDGGGAVGFNLVEIGNGWAFRSAPEHAELIRTMRTEKPTRLSRAALEVLSIVAYRQPATKAEVDYVRGVDCGGTLRGLLDRGLVKIVGKKDEPGRPLLYGTTHRFLSLFNLGTLRQLPTLREYHELNEESTEKLREFEGFPTIEELKENMNGIKEGSDDIVDDLNDAMAALGKQQDVARDALATEGITLVEE